MEFKWIYLHYNMIWCDMAAVWLLVSSKLNETADIRLKICKDTRKQMMLNGLSVLIFCFWFPSAVYHYQFRIQFVNQMERIEPSLTVSFSGTKDESGDLPITMWVLYHLPSGLHYIFAQSTRSLTHAICSWALSSVEKESTLRRAADTHGNNLSCCMKENYKWERW